ncbi:MAG: hypothetical protein Ta2A_04090 [Treponemataceae bacterium]|nr:MAG: hypothetical protein Ta2A_04090 [Treponemataceae bacterium]
MATSVPRTLVLAAVAGKYCREKTDTRYVSVTTDAEAWFDALWTFIIDMA